jgi:hypothetical protein
MKQNCLVKNESDSASPIHKAHLRALVAFLASIGLGVVLATAFAFIACSRGFLFGGITVVFTVFVTAAICAIVATVTALVFERKQWYFTWGTLVIEVLVSALIAVSFLSWSQTRQNMEIFMNPAPVPSEVQVYRGRNTLFNNFVHFTAPPAVIAAIIKSKELVEVPSEPPDQWGVTGYSFMRQAKVAWGWWQPATMTNPRFFYRHHESLEVQGWSEGWWVNAATNEVYAFISG